MEGSLHKEVDQLARLYGLSLEYLEKHGRVYKLYTNKGEYALKRMPAKNGLDFLQYVQQLYQQGYNRIVPIFPTIDGRYGILEGQYLYYLMPWLENREREDHIQRHLDLFRELARLHTLTVRDVPVDKEERKEHYDQTASRWETEQETLEEFVSRCERQVYMSPFQLFFCTIYSEISGSHRYALNKLKDWHEVTEEDTKARSVIIHGKLSNEHFLYDEKGFGYFTNFEGTGFASPIHDLLPFLDRTFLTHPKQFDQTLEWLDAYFRHFPFKEEEMHLFLSYLAHPGPIYRIAENYFSAGTDKSEIQMVGQLQRQYWRMKNTEYVVMKLEERERLKKEQSNSSPSE